MSLAGANKWTLSSRIFTSMVSVGAPGMANSTISLWCSPSAYATVSGATFIRSTCILTPSSFICLFNNLRHAPEHGSEVADLDLEIRKLHAEVSHLIVERTLPRHHPANRAPFRRFLSD